MRLRLYGLVPFHVNVLRAGEVIMGETMRSGDDNGGDDGGGEARSGNDGDDGGVGEASGGSVATTGGGDAGDGDSGRPATKRHKKKPKSKSGDARRVRAAKDR